MNHLLRTYYESSPRTVENVPERATLQQLLGDPDWPLPAELVELAQSQLVSQPAANQPELQERLDGEIQDYLDFCRFRDQQKLRGSVAERHAAWEAACLAEACAILQRQSLRDSGYVPQQLFSEPLRVC
jgi:hypothetical protein